MSKKEYYLVRSRYWSKRYVRTNRDLTRLFNILQRLTHNDYLRDESNLETSYKKNQKGKERINRDRNRQMTYLLALKLTSSWNRDKIRWNVMSIVILQCRVIGLFYTHEIFIPDRSRVWYLIDTRIFPKVFWYLFLRNCSSFRLWRKKYFYWTNKNFKVRVMKVRRIIRTSQG
jgi:dipeptide/tripeptide permease